MLLMGESINNIATTSTVSLRDETGPGNSTESSAHAQNRGNAGPTPGERTSAGQLVASGRRVGLGEEPAAAPPALLAAALAGHTRELLTPLGHAAVLDDPYIAAPVVKP